MLVKPKFRPGIVKTDTALQNEGGYSDGNLVREYQGQMQPVGGWEKDSSTSFSGKARGSHAWTNLDSQVCKAWGTETELYGEVDGTRATITPFLHYTVLTNVFTTTAGSSTVSVALPYHGLPVSSTVSFSNVQATVGGLTINGSYTVTTVVSRDEFTITASSNAGSGATLGGGSVDFKAALPAGLADSNGSGGFARVWSLDNFGENLQAVPSGFRLFEWQPETSYPNLAFNGTFTGNADGWALGSGWAYSANTIAKTPGVMANASQSIIDLELDGKTLEVTFSVTVVGGGLKFRVNAGSTPAVIDVGTASTQINVTGTYTRIFRVPADASDIVFEANAAFDGTIDNVSYKVYDKAYPITTSPARIDAMYVDPRSVVVAIGCTDLNGIYNPSAVRNCGVANNRLWIPDTDNVASEIVLRGGGGRLMAGCATRQQSLVWGDDGVFSLQWLGDAGAAFTPQLLATSCGLLSRHSFAKANGFVIWASNTRDFFIFRGIGDNSLGSPDKIPCPLREDIFDNLDFEQSIKSHGGLTPAFTEFWFFWPDTRDVASPGDPGECSRAAHYNWVSNTWGCHVLSRTSWIPSGVLSNPIGFGADSYVYKHESGFTADSAALGAWLKTSDLDIEDGDKLGTVTAIVPDFAQQSGNINFTIYSKPFANGTAITKGPYTATPTTQRLPVRVLGRQLSMRLDWTTSGGFGRLGALRVDLNQTGAKR